VGEALGLSLRFARLDGGGTLAGVILCGFLFGLDDSETGLHIGGAISGVGDHAIGGGAHPVRSGLGSLCGGFCLARHATDRANARQPTASAPWCWSVVVVDARGTRRRAALPAHGIASTAVFHCAFFLCARLRSRWISVPVCRLQSSEQ
jgi:hypothetical protein